MVVSFNCIHWIPNKAALWPSVHKAMKKGDKFKAVRATPLLSLVSVLCSQCFFFCISEVPRPREHGRGARGYYAR